MSKDATDVELASLHRDLADRLVAEDYPSIADARPTQAAERAIDIYPDQER